MRLIGISRRSELPWFRDRARWAIAVAVALFVAVFAVRLLFGDAQDAVGLLYALPVALVAVAFGRAAGIAAGLLAVVLVLFWAAALEVDLTALGWASRVVPLLLLGGLLGDASDRLAVAGARQLAMDAAEQRHREATEINDTLIQGMAAAKWALEAGRYKVGINTLDATLDVGHELVSKLLREADMGLDGHRPPTATSPAPRSRAEPE